MEALSNIYVNSVKDTIEKLRFLNTVEPEFELVPLKDEFGQPRKIAAVDRSK